MLVWTQIHSHSWDKYIHSLDTNTFRLLRQSLEPGATQKGRVQNIYGSKNTLNEVSLEWTSCWSRKYIHTFETNTLNLWRQIQRLLVEALESGADPVGAWDRFSEHWPTSEWPACTLKSCHKLDYLLFGRIEENKGVLCRVLQWLSSNQWWARMSCRWFPFIFRDTENLHCFLPQYFSQVFCSAIMFSHHYRSAGHCLLVHFCPASSVQRVSALFIQTIGRSRQNKQTQSNSFHKINRRSNWFRQTHMDSSQATKVNRNQAHNHNLNSINLWQFSCAVKTCWENLLSQIWVIFGRPINKSFALQRPPFTTSTASAYVPKIQIVPLSHESFDNC